MSNKELARETAALLKQAAENISKFIERQENKDFEAVNVYKLWHVVNRDMVDEYSGEADAIDFLEILSEAFKEFSEVE